MLTLSLGAGSASATPSPLHGVFSGSQWQASLDGKTNWVSVDSPHYNPITKPVLTINDVVDEVKPRGSLIWHPEVNGEFPTEAYFRLTFNTPTGYFGNPRAWIAADDWMEVKVNNTLVATYLLDDHQDPVTKQPLAELVFFDIDPMPGASNTITIRARDGNATQAYDRQYEWIFFDADNIMTRQFTQDERIIFVSVPVPGTLALVFLGGLCAWFGVGRRMNGQSS